VFFVADQAIVLLSFPFLLFAHPMAENAALQKQVADLQAQVQELQAQLAQQPQQARAKISKMSAEVVDSNPYRSAGRA
jgi:hypothetical protein